MGAPTRGDYPYLPFCRNAPSENLRKNLGILGHPKLCFSLCGMLLSRQHLKVLWAVTSTLTNQDDVIDLKVCVWVFG